MRLATSRAVRVPKTTGERHTRGQLIATLAGLPVRYLARCDQALHRENAGGLVVLFRQLARLEFLDWNCCDATVSDEALVFPSGSGSVGTV